MYHRNARDLHQFYDVPLGRTVRRLVRRKLRLLWPETKGLSILGVGFAIPYLRAWHDQEAEVFAAVPEAQGVFYWPQDQACLTTLVEESELPFPDLKFDRVLLIHGIETLQHHSSVLREIWRVLSPSGRLIVVVPNRRGIWARSERTPFGYSQPYSCSQVSELLKENLFVPERSTRCLYVPPTYSRVTLASAGAWEKIGERWFSAFGGLSMVEASKQLYAMPVQKTKRRRILLPGLLPNPSGAVSMRVATEVE